MLLTYLNQVFSVTGYLVYGRLLKTVLKWCAVSSKKQTNEGSSEKSKRVYFYIYLSIQAYKSIYSADEKTWIYVHHAWPFI